MRVFVDVGAHYGETLEIALDPGWAFDRVFALEPASACQPVLAKFRDSRLEVQPFGLGAATMSVPLYGAGLLGASVFKTKRQKTDLQGVPAEQIRLIRARDWLEANVPPEADVYMKFNCEGSECDILDDLLSAGFADRLTSLYIDFDIRKVDGLTYRQNEVERRLRDAGVSFETSDSLGCVANPAVAKWLASHCPRTSPNWRDALHFRLGMYAPLYTRAKFLAAKLLPLRVYLWLGRRFGRMARAS